MFCMQHVVCSGRILRDEGIDIILFTASVVHLSAVTLMIYLVCVGEFPRGKSPVICT
jgi:hypothetical protein